MNNLFDQLRRDESERLKPYTDTVGKITIGVGRNLTDNGISAEESATMLANDIAAATADVDQFIPWAVDIDPVRKAVLINMALNMGIDGLVEFHDMLRLMQARDYAGAAGAMLQSKWADQVGSRAIRLSQQMESGAWV